MVDLEVIQGPNGGEEFRVNATVITIGRWQDCTITLRDRRVSHRHGEIMVTGRGLLYRDLHSANGSALNCKGIGLIHLSPLASEYWIGEGDDILVGDSVIRVRKFITPHHTNTAEEDSRLMRRYPSATGSLPTQQGTDVLRHGVRGRQDPLMSFNVFLEREIQDPTDVAQVRQRLCEAFLRAFRTADHAGLVELKCVLVPGREMKGDLIDQATVTFAPANATQGASAIRRLSVSAMKDAAGSRGPVVFEYASGDPSRQPPESVRELGILSCMCSPLWHRGQVFGFVQVYSNKPGAPPFRKRDADIFSVIVSVASLVLNQAKQAQEQKTLEKWAAASQQVAALHHDFSPKLGWMVASAEAIEEKLRRSVRLEDMEEWKGLRHEIRQARHDCESLLREASRAGGTAEGVDDRSHMEKVQVKECVDFSLGEAKRLYLSEENSRIFMHNCCRPHDFVLANSGDLSMMLLNCLSNSVYAVKQRIGVYAPIVVGSCDDDEMPGTHLTIAVCDEGCGIPEDVLNKLGFGYYTTKRSGRGIGFKHVVDVTKRLGGRVRLASHCSARPGAQPGTVVAVSLPKSSSAPRAMPEGVQPLTWVPDYHRFRAALVERFHQI